MALVYFFKRLLRRNVYFFKRLFWQSVYFFKRLCIAKVVVSGLLSKFICKKRLPDRGGRVAF